MKKIRIIEHISLDGVIQGPGGPQEDDYRYGGWAAPHDDPAGGEAIVAAHGDDFDLLLGRRTYDIWSGFWPNAPKSPMADSINSATKYIATTGRAVLRLPVPSRTGKTSSKISSASSGSSNIVLASSCPRRSGAARPLP